MNYKHFAIISILLWCGLLAAPLGCVSTKDTSQKETTPATKTIADASESTPPPETINPEIKVQAIKARMGFLKASDRRMQKIRNIYDRKRMRNAEEKHLNNRSCANMRKRLVAADENMNKMLSELETLKAQIHKQTAEGNATDNLKTSLDELQTKIVKLTSRKQIMQQEIQRDEQNIARISARNKELTNKFAPLLEKVRKNRLEIEAEEKALSDITTGITTKITSISQKSGHTKIKLDGGKNRGIKPGMEFMVFNNKGGYKGFVQITTIGENTSTATIIEKGRNKIAEGDCAIEVTWQRANLSD